MIGPKNLLMMMIAPARYDRPAKVCSIHVMMLLVVQAVRAFASSLVAWWISEEGWYHGRGALDVLSQLLVLCLSSLLLARALALSVAHSANAVPAAAAPQSTSFGSSNGNRRSSLLMGATHMQELKENVKETDGEDDEYSDDAD